MRSPKEAEFFSFGTNDLTQTTFGFSRDDINKFLPAYLERRHLEAGSVRRARSEGVGQLVKMAVEKGRKTRPTIKVGICGEHGGEPSSVKFCASDRLQLRFVLAVPRADRAVGGSAGRRQRGTEDRRRKNEVKWLVVSDQWLVKARARLRLGPYCLKTRDLVVPKSAPAPVHFWVTYEHF